MRLLRIAPEGEVFPAFGYAVSLANRYDAQIVILHVIEEIIAESIASDYDVIIMGTHGHGILAGAMMGSTAMRVVRRSHVPVMVIRLPKTA